MKKLILLGMLAILLAPAVQAQSFSSQCINESYMREYINMDISGSALQIEIPITYCPFGCVANIAQYGDGCMKSPEEYAQENNGIYIPIIFAITFVMLIFAYLGIKMKSPEKEFNIIQLLFISLCLLFLSIDMFLIMNIADINRVSQLSEVLYITFLISISTFIVFFIIELYMILKWAGDKVVKSYKSNYKN